MDYKSLIRKARSKNIRVTKNTRNGRRYLTATELRRKLKKRKSTKRRLTAKRTGMFGGIFGGLFRKSPARRRARKVRKLKRKLRKNRRRGRKVCVCSGARCRCSRGVRVKRVGSGIGAGSLFALKTLATGAAIQLGAEAAKRALLM